MLYSKFIHSASIVVSALVGITAASAADLGPRTYTKAPVVVDASYNWSGFYLGLNAGGEWSRSNAATATGITAGGYFADSSTVAITALGAQRVNRSGFTGGLTAGYNWQASNVVFGIESDFNYFGVKGSATGSAVYPCCAPTGFTVNSSVSSDWLITLRPRVGIAANNWMVYVTGGLAVANLKGDFSFTDTFAAATESASISKTKAGWTVGVGTEYALMNGWSVKAEYLYVDLGSESTTSRNLVAGGAHPENVFSHSVDLRSNIVRGGLNYKFGGPAATQY